MFAFICKRSYCVVVVVTRAATRYALLTQGSQRRLLAALNMTTLLLIAAFWLPIMPFGTTTYPAVARILARPSVATTYLAGKRILFVQNTTSLPHILGMLAVSGEYSVVMPNLYGNATASLAYPTLLGLTTTVTDARVYGGFLESILPSLQVAEVADVASENDVPLAPGVVAETSAILGPPVFSSLPDVAIWKVPATIKTDLLTYPLDVLYTAVSRFVRLFPQQPLTVSDLIGQGLLPASFAPVIANPDPHQTAYRAWIGQQAPDTVTFSLSTNELGAWAMAEKYESRALTVGYGPELADAHAPPLPAHIEMGSAFEYLTVTFSLQAMLSA